jgi:hypothetical protein
MRSERWIARFWLEVLSWHSWSGGLLFWFLGLCVFGDPPGWFFYGPTHNLHPVALFFRN